MLVKNTYEGDTSVFNKTVVRRYGSVALLCICLIYFTFRQIFTDMEVINGSTRKCAEHLSQHNLQKEKKKKERKKKT
jgi:hypothetical protein